jgi:DNA helicase II / ATP-dependent DNA helicase PcrA
VQPDDPQQRIINHLDGALLVLAPVGSGKTWALTERIAAAIEAGHDPRRILCLTFTNRAAEEIRSRLRARFPDRELPATVSTFHALCATILRAEARLVGIPTHFAVCDDVDARDLLAEISGLQARDARNLYFDLGRIKSALEYRQLGWPLDYPSIYAELQGARHAAVRYQDDLWGQHLLDFSDLVLCTNSILARIPDVRKRWAERYDLIMVDEIQDTHKSEYRVVYVLARETGNLALFGDEDQTIYEWRGSSPGAIIDRFKEDFGPVTEIQLHENRRATRQLVTVSEGFASATFRKDRMPTQRQTNVADGPSPVWYFADDPEAEGEWIADQIETLRQEPGFVYRHVGVLTANNYYGIKLSKVFATRLIPHVTVEELDFFQRREVKDALALLRLMCNPSETAAMHRVTERLIKGVARGTLMRIQKASEGVGLERVDMLKQETHAYGEPFGRLIDEYRDGRIVVLDLETTGLHYGAEIVEIAATRLVRGEPAAEFHMLVRSAASVGESFDTHHLSDEHLARFGQAPEEALAAAFEFIGDDLVVGHNIGFDLRVLRNQGRRLGLDAPTLSSVDTWLLTQRFLQEVKDRRLEKLAADLGLDHEPSHRAEEDVAATIDLLHYLMPLVEKGAEQRRRIIERDGEPFARWADDLDYWRTLAQTERPALVASQVMIDSGLRAHYAKEPERLEHLDELIGTFEQKDSEAEDTWTALERLVRMTALVRYVDQLTERNDQVPLLTIHQAKGLEFDTVFIAGLYEDELPRWSAVNEGRLAEEQRLFYVALTRARRRLYLSAARSTDQRVRQPSQFIAAIDPELLETFIP